MKILQQSFLDYLAFQKINITKKWQTTIVYFGLLYLLFALDYLWTARSPTVANRSFFKTDFGTKQFSKCFPVSSQKYKNIRYKSPPTKKQFFLILSFLHRTLHPGKIYHIKIIKKIPSKIVELMLLFMFCVFTLHAHSPFLRAYIGQH